jgi:hypothetical protein
MPEQNRCCDFLQQSVSSKIGVGCDCSKPSSPSNVLIHDASRTALYKATHSASTEDVLIDLCRLLFQLTGPFGSVNTKLDVDRLVSGSPAKSLSEYPTS